MRRQLDAYIFKHRAKVCLNRALHMREAYSTRSGLSLTAKRQTPRWFASFEDEDIKVKRQHSSLLLLYREQRRLGRGRESQRQSKHPTPSRRPDRMKQRKQTNTVLGICTSTHDLGHLSLPTSAFLPRQLTMMAMARNPSDWVSLAASSDDLAKGLHYFLSIRLEMPKDQRALRSKSTDYRGMKIEDMINKDFGS
ncbi:uncharacterized protein BT62DRAFT_999290 [Guyanagaster necrorhizus]|uniref:Uncharacterized protein n=1 Tax=Guyanagaster necrorhizus TaxID=856835 RepID=A0A9P7W8E1_9AGAR|nr:uncharacterized protein BT62DRAFT_999290 [Guyanagaster necrorhizus MCA 3950]KAG7453236.1 hypothetical protein BT62DRAFT_999290 [Guyanagaster necrorhizus MCA 3950]